MLCTRMDLNLALQAAFIAGVFSFGPCIAGQDSQPGRILGHLDGGRSDSGRGAVENAAIAGSGSIQIPEGPPLRMKPTSYPRVAGAYLSRAEHPRVFVTAEELKDMAARINTSGSFSAKRFAAVSARVKTDLAANVD